jgi:hypothetical protein
MLGGIIIFSKISIGSLRASLSGTLAEIKDSEGTYVAQTVNMYRKLAKKVDNLPRALWKGKEQ